MEGIGEVYAATFGPKVVEAMIKDVFERHVLNREPFQIEQIWREAYSRGYSQRPDISLMGVVSAIEMALWDIIGKATNKPVHALMGGKIHERLRSYTYLYPDEKQDAADFYNNPDLSAQRAADYVKMGFTGIKFDPAGPNTISDPHQPSLFDMD